MSNRCSDNEKVVRDRMDRKPFSHAKPFYKGMKFEIHQIVIFE